MKLALVLSGGGARAAYQVGVIKYLLENFSEHFQPTIFCGTSAGAINTVFLAQYADNLQYGIDKLIESWSNLAVPDIYKVSADFKPSHMGMNLAMSLLLRRKWEYMSHIRSVFKTDPLRNHLSKIIDFDRVHGLIKNEKVDAITVTATEYGSGKAIVFVESNRKQLSWVRVKRESRQVELSVEHIMASSAIPLVFPAINVEGVYFGDGSMRDKSPFSPAAKLGADKIFAIGIRPGHMDVGYAATEYPSLASIGGTLAEGIFIDAFDADYENLSRINSILKSHSSVGYYKPIDAFFLRPSHDLSMLANDYITEIPPIVRNLFSAIGNNGTSSADFLSYLLFSGGYAARLIRMGYEDGRKEHARIEQFLTGNKVSSEAA